MLLGVLLGVKPCVGHRTLKRQYHQAVEARRRLGLLTEEQSARFKLMFSRCREAKEMEDVMQALRGFCVGIHKDTDRYARIIQDDPLGLED